MKKLELCGKVWELEVSSRQYEHVAENLRAEVVDLNEHNQRYWEELHDLCFESWRGHTQDDAGSSRRRCWRA